MKRFFFEKKNQKTFVSAAAGDPRHGRIGLAAAIAGLLMLFGLWISYQTTMATWGPDSDIAVLPMLWYGFRQHGLSFFETWRYTQDNWLLTLVPMAFAAFRVLGTSPVLVILSGWFIYVGSAVFALLIARRLVPPAYLLVLGPLFLLCNQPTLGHSGFLTYAIDHNSSLLFGFLALLAAMLWISGGRLSRLVLCGFILFIAGTSDPWTKAAFFLPILLAALVSAFLYRGPDLARRFGILALAVVLAGILTQTKAFDAFAFLPDDQLIPVETGKLFGQNCLAVSMAIGAMFNPWPFSSLGSPWLLTAICFLAGGLLLFTFAPAVIHCRRLGAERGFAVTAMLLSCGGVVVAFLIGDWPDRDVAMRFLVNLYFFLPILVGVGLAVRPRSPRASSVAAAFAAMIMISSVAGSADVWWHEPRLPSTLGANELAAFLQSNKLTYGYGAYWGAGSVGVTWVSKNKVLIRPVVFDPQTGHIRPRYAETSTLWYDRSDHMGADRTTFVIVSPDFENCPDLTLCISGVQNQFGPAARVLNFAQSTVLVWPNDLAIPKPL